MAGVIIAAPGSGSGKTMVTCGLLTLLKRKGWNPAAYKCGPDYIDGLFHRRVLGVESGSLDSFFESQTHMCEKVAGSMQKHFVVAEGVMGYYDGLGGVSARASSYEIADITGLPAVLVVDGKGASLSLLALIHGFLCFRPGEEPEDSEEQEKKTDEKKTHDITNDISEEKKARKKKAHGNEPGNHIKGIFFNRMSPMMYRIMKPLVEEKFHIPVVGYLPELEFLQVASRHLGLVLPDEIDGLRQQMELLADKMDESLDWEQLKAIADTADPMRLREGALRADAMRTAAKAAGPKAGAGMAPDRRMADAAEEKRRFRLGIAMDEAFCFYYGDNLKEMERAGAELVMFSPLHHEKLPEGLDGLILGGGYPENHGQALAANVSMRRDVAAAADGGMPVLAECGGYLYLLDSLEGADKRNYPMAGVLRGHGFRAGKTGRFGYITLRPLDSRPCLLTGTEVKGHEFHYWDCRCDGGEFRMQAVKPMGNRTWPCMRTWKRVMAGFPHLYYPSCPELVRRFADQCAEYGKEHKV